MNWTPRFRTTAHPAHWWLTSLLILIVGLSDQVHAQSGSVMVRSLVSSASSRPEDVTCDLLRVPGRSMKLVQKNLSQQRAEYTLGNKLAADVEQRSELITDETIVRYMNSLEQTLANRSQLSGCFVVKVLSDPEPNAYSLPGGFLYITTGFVDLIETESQLVAALAHETAHVTARHQTRLDAQFRFWRRAALIGGPAGYALRRYLGPLLTSKLARNKEFEADRLGLRYDVASGYDPIEFSRLLQIAFSEEEKESFLDRLYATHPSTKTRIQRLQEDIPLLLAPKTSYIVSTGEFADVKMRLAKIVAARQPR
jgi:predicted Zn-dependent protease